MSNAWDAEKSLSLETATSLIAEQFPQLKKLPVRYLAEGWDNYVFEVGQDLLFRFPRRQIAVEFFKAECSILPHLAGTLPLEVPDILYVGKPSSKYEWPFAGVSKVHGVSACSQNLSEHERAQMAASLGEFLKSHHSFDINKARDLGLPEDVVGRANLGFLEEKIRCYVETIEAKKLFKHPKTILEALGQWMPLSGKVAPVLVHGDLYLRHIIVGKNRELRGVIDFGDVHVGDPSGDLSIAYSFLPKESHQEFFDAYGPVQEQTHYLAKLRALYYGALFLCYGRDTDDADLVREGHTTLQLLLQD